MISLCKTTYNHFQSYKQALIKDIFKECRKDVKLVKLTEDMIEKLLADNCYSIYKLNFNISTAEDYMLFLSFLEGVEDTNRLLLDSIVSVTVDYIEENINDFRNLFNKV